MGYDGTLKFDTKIDTGGFSKGISALTKAGAAAGAAIAVGLGAATKAGMAFEEQMSTVGAISGASAEDMELLTGKAQEMGIKTKFSATEAGKAMEYMAMAGWKTGEMVGGIEGIMKLAAASGEDLASTSDIVTDALTAFGLKASDSSMFADVLAAASSNANTNVGMMGETFKYAAPVAGALGYSVQDTAVAIGLMANSGIKAGQAGTSLRSILSRLSKPTKQSQQAMDKLGASLTDSAGNIKPFRQQMIDLRQSFSKLTEAEKVENAALLGGQEAMSGLLAIVNASDEDFNKLCAAVDDSAGAVERMSSARLDNLAGDVTLLKSSAEGLGIAFYNGIKDPAREAVQSAIENVNELTASLTDGQLSGALDNVGKFFAGMIDTASGMVSTFLPAAVNVMSGLSQMSGLLVAGAGAYMGYKTAVGLASTATSLFSAAAGAVTNPLGLAGIAIGGGVAAFVAIKNAVQNSREEFYNMGDALDTAMEKYTAAKEKAALTDDYAAKWRELNIAIASGELSAEELAAAESQRKECEQWFIENYGSYISAEEQKNGVRQETIDKLQEKVHLLSESAKIEATNRALELKSRIPGLAEDVSGLQKKNTELQNTNDSLGKQNIVLQKALNEWSAFNMEGKSEVEISQKLNDILIGVNKSLGTQYEGMWQLDAAIEQNNKTIDKNKEKHEENKKNIDDGTKSLQAYADNCRQIIETDLGDSLAGFAEGYGLIQQAQEELNSTGEISEDTFNAVIDKFPELKESISDAQAAPEALRGKMEELQAKLNEAQTAARDFGVELNGLPRNINIDIKLNVPEVPKFAGGTRGAPGGPAVVNDGNGPELIESRAGALRMVNSKGAALTWLNRGDRVYTAEQTRSILGAFPHYAGGIGNTEYAGTVTIKSFVEKIPKAFDRALADLELRRDMDAIDAEQYYTELAALRDKYFAEGSDKWWDYEKEIYKHSIELADAARDKEFKELDRQLDLGFISESEYYENLAALRDKYYAEGSDEYTDYSDKIYKYRVQLQEKAREREFSALKQQLDYGYISEREYYTSIAALRDEYFTDGSEEWKQYTDEITGYYRQRVNSISSSLKGVLNSTAKLFSDDSLILVGANNEKYLTAEGWVDKTGEDLVLGGLKTADLTEQKKQLERYDSVLTQLLERGTNENLFEWFAAQSIEDAIRYGEVMLGAPADEFERLNAQYADIQDYISKIAEKYGNLGNPLFEHIGSGMTDAAQETAAESAERFGTELNRYFDTIPDNFYDVGADSAERFGDGFSEVIGSVLAEITDDCIAKIQAAAEVLRRTGAETSGDTVNYYNSTYTLTASGSTIGEQLAELRRKEEFDRLRKG